MVLKQMVLVLETDSGTYSNTFLTKPNLLRRAVREIITEHLSWRTLQNEHITFMFQNPECLLRIYFSVHISRVLSMQENLSQECEMFLFVLCCVQWKSTYRLAEEQPECNSFK